MITSQEVQVDVERGIVVIVEETIIEFPNNGSLITLNITKKTYMRFYINCDLLRIFLRLFFLKM